MRHPWRSLVASAAVLVVASGCLRIDVQYLSSDALLGRNNGSPGSTSARDHIIRGLQDAGAVGLVPGPVGAAAFLQPFSTEVSPGRTVAGTNVLGVIPGSDQADEYVIVGAHYDHVASCGGDDPADTICNGATDNATGVAAVLAIAEHLQADPVSRSVVFALWDAEEDGLVGSAHYVQHPVVPLADTVGYVNFDILGANLRPSLRDTTFIIGAESGGDALGDIVDAAAGSGPSEATRLSAIFGQLRSDYASFLNVGVPTVFYSDSTGPCYHTTGDELEIVDFAKLRRQVAMAQEVTVALANTEAPPTFVSGAPLITFADVVGVEATTARARTDAHLFTPEQQAELAAAHDVLVGVVAAGEAAFTPDDWGPAFGAVLTLVELLTVGTCDGFLEP